MNRKMLGFSVVVALFIYCSAPVSFASNTQQKPITWSGSQYINTTQQDILFGDYSYYLEPWRSYMDTWSASQYLNELGINFNVNPKEADATAKVLANARIHSARVEVGWGNMNYDDPTQFRDSEKVQEITELLGALHKYGVRPIILLNANSGAPVPLKNNTGILMKPATAGDTTIYMQDTSFVKPGYTGFDDFDMAGYPLITSCDSTGKCTLSAPLPESLPAGKVNLTTLRFQPLGGLNTAETIQGWIDYVQAVVHLAQKITGGNNFDLEVWNEVSFGSEFLDINNYYNPPVASQPVIYKGSNLEDDTWQAFLPITTDVIGLNPTYRGIKVISGFSNEHPWESGYTLFPGESGFSRHYYTGYDETKSNLNPQNPLYPQIGPITALGTRDGLPNSNNGWNGVNPGTFFVPTYTFANPEYWFYAMVIENEERDVQPFPSDFVPHFRYSNPGNGQQAELWMTETNFNRQQIADQLSKETGLSESDAGMTKLMESIGTKTTLRAYVFYSAKGVTTTDLYAADSADTGFSVIPQAFFQALDANHYQLTPKIQALSGPQLRALANLTKIMQSGQLITSPRNLQVSQLTEPSPRLVFSGDGTAAHPDVYNISDFGFFPYQLSDHEFAIPYYVVTRNLTTTYHSIFGLLDPNRYSMPPETFDVTISNIDGAGAKISAYDPITNESVPVKVLGENATSLTVALSTVDYPRVLRIHEAKTGPLILNPTIREVPGGSKLTFKTSVSGTAQVTWGEYPNRTGGTFVGKYYNQNNWDSLGRHAPFQGYVFTRNDNEINFPDNWNPTDSKDTSAIWTGQIHPRYSEKYKFLSPIYQTDMTVYINGQLVYTSYAQTQGSIALKAGQVYNIEVDYTSNGRTSRPAVLWWESPSQPREIVPAYNPNVNTSHVNTVADRPVQVFIPGGLKYQDGVKIILKSNGLTDQYPEWDYDVRGVNWER